MPADVSKAEVKKRPIQPPSAVSEKKEVAAKSVARMETLKPVSLSQDCFINTV